MRARLAPFVALALFASVTACDAKKRARTAVWAYLNQPECEDRAKFVLDPAKNQKLMAEYAALKGLRSCVVPHRGIDDSACATTALGQACTVQVAGAEHPFEVKSTEAGFKVDFRGSHGYGPDTMIGVETDIAKQGWDRLYLVRVIVKLEGTPEEGKEARLTVRDHGASPRSVRVGEELRAATLAPFRDGQEHRVMLALRRNVRDVEVHRVVQEGWRQRDDEESIVRTSAPPRPRPADPATSKGTNEAGDTRVAGALPAAVVARIVRTKQPAYRKCYEKGLEKTPGLSGKVVARLVIGPTGTVGVASDGGSTMPDKAVVACILQEMRTLTFPNPEKGITIVTYPLTFESR